MGPWELALANRGLAVTIARQYAAAGLIDLDDGIQEALIGLYMAALRYDSERGTEYGTYAGYDARTRVRRAAQRQTHAMAYLPIDDDRDAPARDPTAAAGLDSDEIARLRRALDLLRDRERFVIDRTFGLDGRVALRDAAIGAELGIVDKNVRVCRARALRRLAGFLHHPGD